MLDKDRLVYTINDALAAIGIGRTKLYELASEGKIDLRRVGGRTVVLAASLRKLVDEAEVVRPTPKPTPAQKKWATRVNYAIERDVSPTSNRVLDADFDG